MVPSAAAISAQTAMDALAKSLLVNWLVFSFSCSFMSWLRDLSWSPRATVFCCVSGRPGRRHAGQVRADPPDWHRYLPGSRELPTGARRPARHGVRALGTTPTRRSGLDVKKVTERGATTRRGAASPLVAAG